MIGRKVRVDGELGVVVEWKPLGSGMCDALVEFESGRRCWYASHGLKPADGAPLPSRSEARETAKAEALRKLRLIREQHIADFHKPWRGCEFGKAIIGNAINDAIAELER